MQKKRVMEMNAIYLCSPRNLPTVDHSQVQQMECNKWLLALSRPLASSRLAYTVGQSGRPARGEKAADARRDSLDYLDLYADDDGQHDGGDDDDDNRSDRRRGSPCLCVKYTYILARDLCISV